MTVPQKAPEIDHALRHVQAAIDAWDRGEVCEAFAHLKDGHIDLMWAKRAATKACQEYANQ